MSGRPNIEEIDKLREATKQLKSLFDEDVKLQRTISDSQKRRSAIETLISGRRREIIELLENMDCASRGNTGWEGRFMTFLTELVVPTPKPWPKPFEYKPGTEFEVNDEVYYVPPGCPTSYGPYRIEEIRMHEKPEGYKEARVGMSWYSFSDLRRDSKEKA
jgi:hypothetical protein